MRFSILVLTMMATVAGPAVAAERRAGGKLLLTDGVSTIEGSAGGGLSTWALIAGKETADGIGLSAHVSVVFLPDYTLQSHGVAIGLFDRLEISYARQNFDTPVFFVRDPYKFPDFIRTQKRHPKTNMRSPTAMWDFWSLSPESLHQVTILFSDRGLPVGPQYLNGYGSHTFSFWNDAGERVWCKFHFKTQQGHRHYTNAEAETLIGKSRESYQEELYGAIDRGDFPKWTLFVQIMTQEQADNEVVNPFDLTKVWPHARYPLIEVGVLELNRNPENYFAEIEQAAFSPSNIVRGISFSPDKMLQARIFSYADAHRHRLGAHYEALPVNRPKSPVHTYHKDGLLRFFEGHGVPDAYYEPNSFGGPVEDKRYLEPPLVVSGVAKRYDHRETSEDYAQPRALWALFDDAQKGRLYDNLAAAMHGIPDFIIERQLHHFEQVDPAYAQGVRDALKTMDDAHETQKTEKGMDAMALEPAK